MAGASYDPPAKEEMGHYNSFVVRIWTDEASATFRGHIQHVATRDQANFADVSKMIDFVMEHLGPPPGAGVEGDTDDTQEVMATLKEMRESDG